MNKAVFNELITLEYPDDFNQLSDIENEKYFSGNLLRLSFQNREKHILLSLSKSKDSFLNRLVSVASVLNGSLGNLAKNLKEYQYIEEFDETIFDSDSHTACFSYLTNDEKDRQYGELSIFKVKKSFYIVYCICRLEDKDKYKTLFKEFRKSFKED